MASSIHIRNTRSYLAFIYVKSTSCPWKIFRNKKMHFFDILKKFPEGNNIKNRNVVERENINNSENTTYRSKNSFSPCCLARRNKDSNRPNNLLGGSSGTWTFLRRKRIKKLRNTYNILVIENIYYEIKLRPKLTHLSQLYHSPRVCFVAKYIPSIFF